MKKFLSILFTVFVFLALKLPSLAVITPEETTSEVYIHGHGYSDEMFRLIDLEHSYINCTQPKYKSKDPALYSDKRVNAIRKVFMYFDPGLDNEKFMKHNIKYTNTWSEDI